MATPNAEASVKNLPDSGGESGKTYTEKDYQDMRNAVLGEAGKVKAEGEKALKAGQAALDRIAKWEQEQVERELEAHKDDPAEIRRIRAEQKAKEVESKLATREQELSAEREKLKTFEVEKAEATKTQTIGAIAKRLDVDVEKLIKLSKHTDGSPEAIEEIAKELPKVNPKKPLRPDSNRSIGGNLTWEQVRSAFIQDPYDPVVKERYMEMRAQQHR